MPINHGNTLNFNRDDMTMTTIGVMQEVTPSQKRKAASNILEAEAQQFHTEQAATARSIQRDVALVWLDTHEAQRKTTLYQRLADEMDAERKVAISRISSGAAQANDVLRLDTELSMTKDKLLTTQRDERRARAGLEDWHAALMEGAVLRVRPKAMTVAVILAGLMPILLGTGTGSETMSRIAAPMVGGMLTAPLLSLFVLPAAYVLLRRTLKVENI